MRKTVFIGDTSVTNFLGSTQSSVVTPVASKPAPVDTASATNTVAEQTVTTTANSTATTPAPETNGNGDSAKRAEDILKLIRARQSN